MQHKVKEICQKRLHFNSPSLNSAVLENKAKIKEQESKNLHKSAAFRSLCQSISQVI